jgi:Domain of Unknown Function with PDB structure (DUF3857)/Transglutaminase-like superfamily
VIEKLATRVREEDDGTGSKTTTARIHILADAGVKDMAVLAFTYTASNQQVDVGYVRVVKPDGTVVSTPDYNIQDLPADVTREAPMYSDIHQKHVAVKGLGVGDTLEYQMTLRTLKPDVPGQFWLEYGFEKNLIVLDEQFDLDVPAGRKVTVASADAQPAITTSGDRKMYHWASANLARPDPDAPPKSTKDKKPSVQVTTFTSWDQVGAWYASLQKDAIVVTPAIQAKADELTKGLTSDDEKIRAIFDYVALDIHYVGLDFGIGRYQPHSADDVLSNEYGDCKDKHTLLATLLKSAGIEAWPVLISSSSTLDAATPSPAQFDHVITIVPRNGKLIWMDSTAEVAPVGVLFDVLRDKQALAVPLNKPAYLERTPADLPFLQKTRFETKGSLSDQGTFAAHVDQAYLGDAEFLMRAIFRGIPQSQWKELMQGISNNLGFGGDVKEPNVSAIEKIADPLTISYDYTREKFGEWDSRRISPPLPPIGMELGPGTKETRPADDVDLGSPGEVAYSASITIPDGWWLSPPPATDVVEDWGEYHAKYAYTKGAFTAERRLVIKQDKVPLAQWDKYLAFRRAIYDDELRMTALVEAGESAGGPYGAPGSVLSGILAEMASTVSPLNDVAAVLDVTPPPGTRDVLSAEDQCRKVVTGAETKSTQLAVDDPNSLYWAQVLAEAWTCMGWAELEARETGAAESYLRPAWKVSQSRLSGYELGRVLVSQGKKAEASHLFVLANVSGVKAPPGISQFSTDVTEHHLAADYKTLTGKDLTATALNRGEYTGSLQAELDRELELRQLVKTTRLTGSGYYAVAFEEGKPAKAAFLGGDKDFASLVPLLEAHTYPAQLPTGSKARLLREVKVICTPYAGCDGNFVLPNAIELPSRKIVINVSPPNAPPGKKTVRVIQVPVQ